MRQLRQHMNSQTKEKNCMCDICNKTFQHQQILCMHRNTHNKEKHYMCEICNKTFMRQASLHRHMNIHTRQKIIFVTYAIKNFDNNETYTCIWIFTLKRMCTSAEYVTSNLPIKVVYINISICIQKRQLTHTIFAKKNSFYPYLDWGGKFIPSMV